MGRHKNDGRGKTPGSGRQKGTPNKVQKPTKAAMANHTAEYFTPYIEEKDERGKPTGRLLSPFDVDMMQVDPATRIHAQLQLAKFNVAQMQSTSVDVSVADMNMTLTQRLARLAGGEDIASGEGD